VSAVRRSPGPEPISPEPFRPAAGARRAAAKGCRRTVKKTSRSVLTPEPAGAYKAPIDAAAHARRRQTLPRNCRADLPDLGREWKPFPRERLPSGKIGIGPESLRTGVDTGPR
jgi:hypothetical protein